MKHFIGSSLYFTSLPYMTRWRQWQESVNPYCVPPINVIKRPNQLGQTRRSRRDWELTMNSPCSIISVQ
jgi:hypothetical protein